MLERIIDANLNRLAEGLRVIEDSCRFGLDDAKLAGRLKRLRHEAGRLRKAFPAALDARDSEGDVGRVKVAEPRRRDGLLEMLGASFGRVQESLRVIEEIAKTAGGEAAARAKAMRFEAYELERLVIPLFDRRSMAARLGGLYLVMTEPDAGYERLARLAVARRVSAIQLRDKRLEGRDLLAMARRLRRITAGSRTLFFVNDRPDVARLAEADGVHLGQTDLPPAEARRIVGPRMLIGKSTHNLAQMRAALAESPDYVAVGPIHPTDSKAVPDPVLGLKRAGRMLGLARKAGVPAVAIGGINPETLPGVLEAGFESYALITSVGRAADPGRAIAALRRLEPARPPHP